MAFFFTLLVCGRALPSSAGRLVLDLKSATRLRHTKSHSLPGGDSVPLPFDPARCTSSVMTWGRRALMLSSYRTTRPRGFERETKYLEGFAGFLRKTQKSYERQSQHPRVQYSSIYSWNHTRGQDSSIETIAGGT